MTIHVKNITGTPADLLARLDRKQWYEPAIARMATHRQREWLTVRVLLKEVLGQEKQILYTDTGKPYLADATHRISISHTRGYVALALAPTHPVAIDIERIQPRVENIRSRFMNTEEEHNLSPTHPLIHLLLHWSAKETMVKLMDDRAINFQSQLHIQPFEPALGDWGELLIRETKTTRRETVAIHYLVSEHYVLTVAPTDRHPLPPVDTLAR
jgi:phosphopantetheinyl transferase